MDKRVFIPKKIIEQRKKVERLERQPNKLAKVRERETKRLEQTDRQREEGVRD